MSDRLEVLAEAVRTESGPGTTARVRRLYADRGVAVPFRRTARRDLRVLARRGALIARRRSDGATHYLRKEHA
ncbi:hypothetical protein QNO07_09650 [Streptomyces sp. 549]|uniref:hypothetical protein n=1 Tax=Streptomyces sp. 549 TaxID=3049076 RepID=UPI0024C2EDD8|nr:hypothetical protein [Streptomyces sp. 549]MDK1473684.1 hypothetical protein [Streptomyces sp. 549]